jgi:L-alanine-DL-glutamate epimerase-like enolase superfamily enzyme
MKITGLDVWSMTMRLSEPYTIAYESVDAAVNVFIRIKTSGGIVGYGCAAPDTEVTGETPGSALDFINSAARYHLMGKDPLNYRRIVDKIACIAPPAPSCTAAVDMALLDILGKISGLPLFRLLGGMRDRIATSATIGILPVDETVRRAVHWVGRGFSSLKIKGGIDVEQDIERILMVRETVGEAIDLSLDANQGYTPQQAMQFVRGTKKARPSLLEQPTPRGDLELMGYVCAAADIPIMADESLLTVRDAAEIARHGIADMFNVKIMKVGGISTAMEIGALARAFDIGVMAGCTDEAALGIAAGLHFALAAPAVVRADLDGHLPLTGDPTSGAVILEDGWLSPTGRPGLGFDIERWENTGV